MPAASRLTRRSDAGQISAFVVVLVAAVVLFAGLVLDGGLALAAKSRAIGQAQEAARAGAQALDLAAYRADGTVRLDPARAEELARAHLAADGATGTVRATTEAVYVEVTARQGTQLLRLAGLDVLSVTGQGRARPEHGVNGPVGGAAGAGP